MHVPCRDLSDDGKKPHGLYSPFTFLLLIGYGFITALRQLRPDGNISVTFQEIAVGTEPQGQR
jgi:hypothetical protein